MAEANQNLDSRLDQSDQSRVAEIFDSQHDIRILVLLPGKFGSPLRGELKIQKLIQSPLRNGDAASEERPIRYDALSYTWGSTERKHSIQIDCSRDVYISENLWTALQHLRSQSSSQDLWVDQICIDQSNLQERNNQVKLMGSVYQKAHSVLIWVGASQNFRLYDHNRAPWYLLANKLITPLTRRFHQSNRVEYALRASGPSPWPCRGWVIQEALLASQDPVICVDRIRLQPPRIGPVHCWLSRLHALTGNRYTCDLCGSRFVRNLIWYGVQDILRLREVSHRSGDVFDFADIMGMTQTSDPRDKIYSLLSLLEGSMRDLIQPDYNEPVAVVYAQVTAAYSKIHDNFLALAVALSLRASGLRNEQPSMGPSWSVNYSQFNVDWNHIKPAREIFRAQPYQWIVSRPKITIHCDFDRTYTKLSMTGIEFDRIIAVGDDSPFYYYDRSQFLLLARPKLQHHTSSELSCDHSQVAHRNEGGMRHDANPYEALRNGQPHPNISSFWETYFPEQDISEEWPWRELLARNESGIFSEWLSHFAHRSEEFDTRWVACRTELLKCWSEYFGMARSDVYLTASGFVGLAGKSMPRIGDRIVLPYGSQTPLILRANDNDDTFTSISFTYVNGIMHGELLKFPDLQLPERTFVLR